MTASNQTSATERLLPPTSADTAPVRLDIDKHKDEKGQDIIPAQQLPASEYSTVVRFIDENIPAPTADLVRVKFETLSDEEQKKLAEYFFESKLLTRLKGFIDKKKYAELSAALVEDFQKLSEREQKKLIDHYIENNLAEYRLIRGSAWSGYAGEFFYINFDYQARKQIVPSIVRSVSDGTNVGVNLAATPFVALANIVFNPNDEALGYMTDKMLNPEKSLVNEIKKHPVLATMFALFAFGGGYVEVQPIDPWLDDHMGNWKYAPISLLIYSAISYYTAFNFKDTLVGFEKWKNAKSLVLQALRGGEGLGERITAAFTAMHEFLTFVERVTRIGYGGFVAGGFPLAIPVGVGTMPIALGTRCMATRKMYYPVAEPAEVKEPASVQKPKSDDEINTEYCNYVKQKAEYDEYLNAKNAYDTYQRNYKIAKTNYDRDYGFFRDEWRLVLNPTVLLTAPAAYFAYQFGKAKSSAQEDVVSVVIGSACAAAAIVLSHSIFRQPAKRQVVNELTAELTAAQKIAGAAKESAKAKLAQVKLSADKFLEAKLADETARGESKQTADTANQSSAAAAAVTAVKAQDQKISTVDVARAVSKAEAVLTEAQAIEDSVNAGNRNVIKAILNDAKHSENTDGQPNLASRLFTSFANGLDQTSRTLAMVFSLQQMFPETFDTETNMGVNAVVLAGSVSAFIASSAFRYQMSKGVSAIAGLAPCIFKTKKAPPAQQPASGEGPKAGVIPKKQ